MHTGGYAEPPTPAPVLVAAPARAPRRRAALAALVLSGLALVAVALLALLPLRHSGVSDPASSQASGTGTTSPLASLPIGVSIPADGSYIRTRVLASGDLHVDQWIRSGSALSSITLSVPRVPGLAAGAMQTSHISVTGSRGPGQGPSSVGAAAQTYRLDGTGAVHLSYDVSGAVERSSSVQGRALARVTGLDVRYASQRGPSTASVQGAKVLVLACSPPRADAVPRPCGAPGPAASPDAWTVQLDGAHRNDRVMAQLDLG
ncbi:MAG: hypothetical protein ACR2FG_08090 [Marmoricola sp.]